MFGAITVVSVSVKSPSGRMIRAPCTTRFPSRAYFSEANGNDGRRETALGEAGCELRVEGGEQQCGGEFRWCFHSLFGFRNRQLQIVDRSGHVVFAGGALRRNRGSDAIGPAVWEPTN